MRIRRSSPRRLRGAMAGRRSGRTFWSDLKRIFDHWLNVRHTFFLSQPLLARTLKPSPSRSMLIAYSFTHLARISLYFLSSFDLIVLGRRHNGTDSAHRGINLRSSLSGILFALCVLGGRLYARFGEQIRRHVRCETRDVDIVIAFCIGGV